MEAGEYRVEMVGGREVKIDAEDLSLFLACPWNIHSSEPNRFYLSCRINGKRAYFHRLAIGAPPGREVDHVNGDTLDNRRSNLRLCTSTENKRNQTASRSTPSGYKGVSLSHKSKPWRANITVCGRQYLLGNFETKEEAARAYNDAARIVFGPFARLNDVN